MKNITVDRSKSLMFVIRRDVFRNHLPLSDYERNEHLMIRKSPIALFCLMLLGSTLLAQTLPLSQARLAQQRIFFNFPSTPNKGGSLLFSPDFDNDFDDFTPEPVDPDTVYRLFMENPGTISGISEYPNVHELSIWGNDHDWSFTEIPDEIVALSHLRSIEVHSTDLSYLPEDIGTMHSLEALHVAWNRVTELPASIASLPSLRELAIDSRVRHIPANPNIETLILHIRHDTDNDSLFASLSGLTGLKNLIIKTSGTIPSTTMVRLATSFPTIFPPLLKLEIHTAIDRNTFQAFSRRFPTEELYIEQCTIQKEDLPLLAGVRKIGIRRIVEAGSGKSLLADLPVQEFFSTVFYPEDSLALQRFPNLSLELNNDWGQTTTERILRKLPGLKRISFSRWAAKAQISFKGLDRLEEVDIVGVYDWAFVTMWEELSQLPALKSLKIGATGLWRLDEVTGGFERLERLDVFLWSKDHQYRQKTISALRKRFGVAKVWVNG